MSVDEPQFNLSVVSNDVYPQSRLHGEWELTPYELDIAHWCVLINCKEVKYWKDTHLGSPQVRGDVAYHNRTFANFFGTWVSIYSFSHNIYDV